MYTRKVKPHEQDWLLESLSQAGFDDGISFRARQYTLVIEDGSKVGFGKLRPLNCEDYAVIENVYYDPQSEMTSVRSLLFEALLDFAYEEEYTRVLYFQGVPPKHIPFHSYSPTDKAEIEVLEHESMTHERGYEISVADWLEFKTSYSDNLRKLASEFGYDENATTKYSVNSTKN